MQCGQTCGRTCLDTLNEKQDGKGTQTNSSWTLDADREESMLLIRGEKGCDNIHHQKRVKKIGDAHGTRHVVAKRLRKENSKKKSMSTSRVDLVPQHS